MSLQAFFPFSQQDTGTEIEVDKWVPSTDYQVTITSPKEMQLLVGVNGGVNIALF